LCSTSRKEYQGFWTKFSETSFATVIFSKRELKVMLYVPPVLADLFERKPIRSVHIYVYAPSQVGPFKFLAGTAMSHCTIDCSQPSLRMKNETTKKFYRANFISCIVNPCRMQYFNSVRKYINNLYTYFHNSAVIIQTLTKCYFTSDTHLCLKLSRRLVLYIMYI